MSNNEEKFKENLQRLVDSKEIPFDESHWESARNYIDSKRKDQRNRWLYLSFAALLVIGTSFTVLNLDLSKSKEIAVSAPESNANISSPKPADAPLIDSQTSQNSSSGQKALPEKSSSEKKVHKNVVKNTTVNPAATSAEFPEKKKTSPPIVSTEEKATAVKSDAAGKVTVKATRKPQNKKEEIQTPPVVSAPPVVLTPPAVSTPQVKEDEMIEQKQEPHVAMAPAGDDPSKQAVNEEPVAAVDNATTATAAPVIEEEKSKEENSSEIVAAAVIPSVAVNKDQADAIPLTPNETKEVIWSVEGGLSYMFGWKGVDSREANGINPVLGIHYFDYLSEKISVSFGAQYNRVGNLSNSSFSSSVTKYSLGEESKVTVITPARLHYITVPFRGHYNIDTKNSVGFAYSISYLMNVEAKVEKYTVVMGQRSDESTYTTAGYTEGFRLFDSQLSLFYKRSLYKGIGVKAEVFLGLNDIKDNSFFKADVFERNTGIKLMLVYDIFRK